MLEYTDFNSWQKYPGVARICLHLSRDTGIVLQVCETCYGLCQSINYKKLSQKQNFLVMTLFISNTSILWTFQIILIKMFCSGRTAYTGWHTDESPRTKYKPIIILRFFSPSTIVSCEIVLLGQNNFRNIYNSTSHYIGTNTIPDKIPPNITM